MNSRFFWGAAVPRDRVSVLDPLRWLAVLSAIAVTLLRMSPTETDVIGFLAHAFSSRASISQDPYVKVLTHAPYSLASSGLAKLIALFSTYTNLSPEFYIASIALLLWAVQGFAIFRLAEIITRNRFAAALATLFYGWEIPFLLGDGPYHMNLLERSLCMAPYLWGLQALFEKRRWRALLWNAVATYLHATPAIYLWPLLFWEDWYEAARDSKSLPGALWRTGIAAAAAAPLFFLVSRDSMSSLPPGFVHMSILTQSNVMAGIGHIFPDKLFMVEGYILLLVLTYRFRNIAAMPTIKRFALLCAAYLLLGRVAFWGYQRGLGFCLVPLRMQLWVSPCILELFMNILMAAWIVSEIEVGSAEWPVLLFVLTVPSSMGHDFILRGIVVLLAMCLVWGNRRPALFFLFGTALLSVSYRLRPGLILRSAGYLGLRGGIFHLPTFLPATGMALLVCLALGFWLESRRLAGATRALAREKAAACAIVLVLSIMDVRLLAGHDRIMPDIPLQTDDHVRMAEWIKENTPPSASILCSPIYGAAVHGSAQEFMILSERSLFASGVNMAPARFGNVFASMAERPLALGYDPFRVDSSLASFAEMKRIDALLTPALANRISSQYGTGFLLLNPDRPWPGKALHREGTLALYALPAPVSGGSGQKKAPSLN